MRIARHAVLPAVFLLLGGHAAARGTSGPGPASHPLLPAAGRLFDTWMGYDVGTWTTGRNNIAIAVGDIDGDLDLDFVASKSDHLAYNFAVVKNNGDGTYGQHVLVGAISESGDIALADVDGDGDRDVLLVDAGQYGAGSTISVYRNDGQGAFGNRQSFPAGPSPMSLAAADFDADGDLDVAVTNHGFWAEGSTVTVLRNDGSGSFTAPATYPAGLAPAKIVAADLNADGWADLAIASDPSGSVRGRVTILMNSAGSGFAPAVAYDASLPQGFASDGGGCLAVGDMDNDGDLDIVYSTRKTYIDGILPYGGYFLFSNNGNGTYAPKQYKTFGVPYSQGVEDVQVGDLDGNGWLDIVGAQFSNTAESAYYVVLRGGASDYPPARAYPSGQGVYDLALADANGDGALDVFIDDYYSYDVTVHDNLGTGTFRAAPRFDTTPLHRWMDAGDIDGDGDLDVATAGGYGTEGSLAVLRNGGPAVFSLAATFQEPYSPGGIKLRDLDGGGSLDLVWGDFNAPNGVPLHVHYRLNNGVGNFGPSVTVPMSMADINDVHAIDLNGDGRLDIVASDSLRDEIKVALNLGGGVFSSPAAYAGPSGPTQIVFGDFDGDGKVDVAVTGPEPYGYSHEVGVLRGNGDGSFQAVAIYTVDDGPYAIATADLNGDGHLDLVTANRGFENDRQPSLSVLIGNGDGAFQPEQRHVSSALTNPSQVIAVDADGDGDNDLLVSNYASHDLSFFANRGDGTFEPHVRYGVDTEFTDFRYADFDGDGIRDIAGLCSPALPGLRSVISMVRGSALLGASVATAAATGITEDSAILNASVNPNGYPTAAFFRYGSTTAYGLRTPAQPLGSGTTPVPLSAQVGGLSCGTVYHYRAVASYARTPTGSRGIASGADATFTTAPCPRSDRGR
jgi:hypothetical protein